MLSTWNVTLAQQPMLCGYATPESGIGSFTKRNDLHPARWT